VSDVAGEVEEDAGGVLAEDGAVRRRVAHGGGRLPEPVLQS